MTQEDRELLLNALCAMLPHGVMCDIGLKHPLQLKRILVDGLDGILLDFYENGNDYQVYLSEVKPYLRPMGSMTESEIHELSRITNGRIEFDCGTICSKSRGFAEGHEYLDTEDMETIIDWLNKHHFDYRGLIEKNLALDCTGLHIYD